MCECGYTHEQHLEVAIKPHTFQGKEWDPKKHVHEMPTDAFGDIVFTGLSQKAGKVGPIMLTLRHVGPCDPVADFLGGGLEWGRENESRRLAAWNPLYTEEWHGVVCTLQANERRVSRGRKAGLPEGGMSSF